jgi:hypothetical protein
MRRLYPLIYLFLFELAMAQAKEPATPNELMVGVWHSETETEPGRIIVVEMQFLTNHTFNGIMQHEGMTVWHYGGTWEINDDELTCCYTESSQPQSEGEKVDVDTIVSLTENEYICQDMLNGTPNGKMYTFNRITEADKSPELSEYQTPAAPSLGRE